MIQKLKRFSAPVLTILAVLLVQVAVIPQFASAATVTCADGTTAPTATDCTCKVGNEPSCPANQAKGNTDPAANGTAPCTKSNCNLIKNYIDPLVTLLAALVGVSVTISIVVGGIQYSSSAGDPAKASAAKNRIRNSIVALITFLLLFSLLQFLVPGGIFK